MILKGGYKLANPDNGGLSQLVTNFNSLLYSAREKS